MTRRTPRREFRERVGDRIKARRTAASLSQSQLARKLPGRVEGGQISRWERGESFPTYANVLALARALGVSEELLLCGCGEEHATNDGKGSPRSTRSRVRALRSA